MNLSESCGQKFFFSTPVSCWDCLRDTFDVVAGFTAPRHREVVRAATTLNVSHGQFIRENGTPPRACLAFLSSSMFVYCICAMILMLTVVHAFRSTFVPGSVRVCV